MGTMDSEKAKRITVRAEEQRKSRLQEAEAKADAEDQAIADALEDAIGYDLKEPKSRKSLHVPRWLRPCYNTCYNRTFRRLRKILRPIVKNKYFDLFTTMVILASAIIMGVEAELWNPNSGTPKPAWIDPIMWIVNCLFLGEWVLRFIVGGGLWLKETLNIGFTFAAWAPFFLSAFGDTVEIVRIVLRLLRFGKAIHTIKNVKGFKVIWLLLSGLFASAGTLFWSCLLLATSVLFFSIIAVDLIGYADAWTYQPEDAIPRWFISLRSSMFTMSRFMSSDGAMDVVEYLMQVPWVKEDDSAYPTEGQPYIWIFLFAFEALSQYVILNLVTAVICDNSMKIVSEDEANRAAEAEEEKKKQIEELRELFKLLDSDDSGEVDTEEFDGAFEIPALKNKLLLLGLDEKELKRFFRALDSDGSGSMGIDEFCEGIPELFGQATAFSMLKAKKKAEKAEKLLRRIKDNASKPSVHDRVTTVESTGELQLQERVADQMRDKYDMGLAAAFYSPKLNFTVASGYTDAGLGMGNKTRLAQVDDLYVWGSTTKMITAPAVLQLVEQGKVNLTDPIALHIDPILIALNGTRLEDHFGSPIHGVQIQHLLHMTSGIQDYDGEAFSRAQFANRSKAFGPIEIIGKFVSPTLQSVPGQQQMYCSTNYILLGLVLATHYHQPDSSWAWQNYDQASVVPKALQKVFKNSKFVMSGPCSQYTPVHGFMEFYPSAQLPKQDVWDVSCLGGWTAGNYVGSVADVARFTYELYNKKKSSILSSASQALLTNFSAPHMGPFPMKFYGMGTFNLAWSVGTSDAYGHVGDTYGYQSQTTYIPEDDFVITVATNVETTKQAQPADFTCLAYHELKAVLTGRPKPHCAMVIPQRFIGKCVCMPEIVV